MLSITLQQQISHNRPDIDHDLAVAIAGEAAKICAEMEVDCQLVVAIMAQESMYRLDAIGGSDFGIMQVSSYNIKAHKLSKELLLTDLNYSIRAGVQILKYFQKRYAKKEKKWWCRYNVGTGRLGPKRRALCDEYVRKVVRYYPKSKELELYKEKAAQFSEDLMNYNPLKK